MARAKVTLPKGTESIRIYRLDNTFFDLRDGDTVDLDGVPATARADRLAAGHFMPSPTSASRKRGRSG